MEIRRAGIIGVGALGIIFGTRIAENCGEDAVSFIADRGRIERYKKDGVYCNDRLCDLRYIDKDDETAEPVDLLMIAVKYTAIHEAIDAVKHVVGKNTTILTIINGVVSERDVAEAYGWDKVIYCSAQGMDAMKDGSRFHYKTPGTLVLGERDNAKSPRLMAIARFFDRAHINYRIPDDIMFEMWNKLMLNVGCNQVSAVRMAPYGKLVGDPDTRKLMLDAMEEARTVAAFEGIHLTDENVAYWLDLLGKLDPEGFPSMAQDVMACRRTELGLFAGYITELAKKYGVPTPVNDMLKAEIEKLEANY